MDLTMEARNARLEEVFELLKVQNDVKYDVVVPSKSIRYQGGHLFIAEGATSITEDGVSLVDAVLRPTEQFEDGLADKLGIPRAYLRRMREQGLPMDLLSANINYWLEREDRNFLVRGFRTDDPNDIGIARAFLSDRYHVIDHIDSVIAMLDGIARAGVQANVVRADLSERNLRIVVSAPEVRAAAEVFTASYRSPFTGTSGRELPFIGAGLVFRNSETGGGANVLAPFVTVEVCTNGMTRTTEAERKVHIGSRLSEGEIEWSEETKRHNIELIRSQATDAVRTWLSQDYIEKVARELDHKGAATLDRPTEAVEQITKGLGYTEAEREAILDMFVKGGDARVAGIPQAITAYAQTVEDPDRAADLEADAFTALDRAFALVRR